MSQALALLSHEYIEWKPYEQLVEESGSETQRSVSFVDDFDFFSEHRGQVVRLEDLNSKLGSFDVSGLIELLTSKKAVPGLILLLLGISTFVSTFIAVGTLNVQFVFTLSSLLVLTIFTMIGLTIQRK